MYVTAKDGTEYLWDYDYDADWSVAEGEPSLMVTLWDADYDGPEDPQPLDVLGGVTVPFDISDHGNINASPEIEEYLRQTAQDMADNL